jgi:N-acetylglucosamine-6-phosphate deacetylase
MSDLLAITGARIFDSATWHDDAALLIEFGYVAGIVPAGEIPASSTSRSMAAAASSLTTTRR